MALFKICRGNESNLPDTLTDGYAYFCTDTGNFYIDWADAEANVSRKHINAEYATKLRFKDANEEWVEIDPKDLHALVGFEQVQANWDENDPTSKSYILNRPFGLIPNLFEAANQNFTAGSGSGNAYIQETYNAMDMSTIAVGETYIVVWDGVSYSCQAVTVTVSNADIGMMKMVSLGNPKLYNACFPAWHVDADENSCPFFIGGIHVLSDTSGTHSYSVRSEINFTKLDPKYLPDEVATKELVMTKVEGLDAVISAAARTGSYNDITERIVGDVVIPLEQHTFTFYPSEFSKPVWNAGRYKVEEYLQQIVQGQSYRVVWDGEVYVCDGMSISALSNGTGGLGYVAGCCILGNPAVWEGVGIGADTGEPFCIAYSPFPATNISLFCSNIYTSSDATTHTISITPVDDVIKLDKKYLPDDLATEKFVEDKIANIKVPGGGTVEQQIDVIPEIEISGFYSDESYNGLYTITAHHTSVNSTLTDLSVGDTCTVVWGEQEYVCTVGDSSSVIPGTMFIGDGTFAGLSGNDEPFGIAWDNTGATFAATDGSTDESHTVRIYQTKVSSAGGVSSWNDLTDKPFYEEEIVVFEGEFQGAKLDSDSDGVEDTWEDTWVAPYNNEDPLVVGETYTFYWDGVAYTSECYSVLGVGAIGFHIMTLDGLDAYPVAIACDPTGFIFGTPAWLVMLPTIPDISHSGVFPCKIVGKETKKIDDKYQHQPDWDETDVNRASFVKNKPFGVLSKAGVLYESDVSYEANDFGFMLMDFASEDVIIGGNYKVSVNGVSYTGVCEGAGSLDDGAITYTHLVRLNADGYSTLELVCNPTLVEVGVTMPAALAPEKLLGDTRWENGEVCHIVISAMDEIVATVPHKYLDFIESHEDIVIPKMDVEMWLEGGLFGTHIPATPEALQKIRSHDGGSIYVQYDGVEYKTKIYASNYFGDVSFVGAGVESTGEPYVVYHDVIDTQDVWVLVDLSGTSSDATSTITKSIKVWFDEQATIKHEFLDFIETTPGTETDVLAETTLEVVDAVTGPNGALSLIGWPESLALDSTQSYFIVWDGATYECVPTALMDGFAMGDPYIYDRSSTTNGAPFLFMFGSASGTENCLVTTDTTSTSHVVRIYQSTPSVSKIKEEYLPEIHAEPAEIPYFDLTAMGLPEIPLDGTWVTVSYDMTELRDAAARGVIKTTARIAGLTMDTVSSLVYIREADIYSYTNVGTFGGTPVVIMINIGVNEVRAGCAPLTGGTTTTMTDVSQEGA